MHLKKFFVPNWKRCAAYYRIQSLHRKGAIETALKIFADQAERERSRASAPFSLESINTIQSWLAETLIQGAYLREFHIFECEIKEYINNQRKWCGIEAGFAWKRAGENIVLRTVAALSEFGVSLNTSTISEINDMRLRVNSIKHDEGIHLEDFVSESEYMVAAGAIRALWNELDEIERPSIGDRET